MFGVLAVSMSSPPVFGVVRAGQDDPPRVLQDSAGSRGARDPVLPGRQALGRAPVRGEGLQTSLAQPGLGEGEGNHYCIILLMHRLHLTLG